MAVSAPDLSDDDLAALLKERGQALGFALTGITSAARLATFDSFADWLQQGYHGEMQYLPRRQAAYEHPAGVLASVRSIIMAALPYTPSPGDESSFPAGSVGRIAAYAQGTADYHDVLKEKLHHLAAILHEQRSGCRTRVTVDTAPLLERDLARQAGLGWFGKNTMLLNRRFGSYFFLGAVLTDCELPPDEFHETSHCGTCTRCLDACPTGAFIEPFQLDARKCISYLTIELRDRPIPVDLRGGMGDWLFGCDVCQQVCPWNRFAPPSPLPEFQPREDLSTADAERFLVISDEEFLREYGLTPLARPGRIGMARNAAIVLGNGGDRRSIPCLGRGLEDRSPLVRAAAAWGLGRMGGEESRRLLHARLAVEADATVIEEIRNALAATSGEIAKSPSFPDACG